MKQYQVHATIVHHIEFYRGENDVYRNGLQYELDTTCVALDSRTSSSSCQKSLSSTILACQVEPFISGVTCVTIAYQRSRLHWVLFSFTPNLCTICKLVFLLSLYFSLTSNYVFFPLWFRFQFGAMTSRSVQQTLLCVNFFCDLFYSWVRFGQAHDKIYSLRFPPNKFVAYFIAA